MGVYVEIPGIAAGTWKPGVAAASGLPTSGNSAYDARVALSEQTIYIWNGSAWVAISGGGGGGVTTVGAFSSSAQTNGASISSTTITFGPASATVPGMVSIGAQTWAGVKTFSSQPIFSTLTASKPVFSDSSKGLTSTGVVPVASGGTNSSAALNSNRIMVSVGGAVVEQSALTAGKLLFTDSNGLPAVDTWSYDSTSHILKTPVNSGNNTNILQFGTNANNFIGTEDGDATRQVQRIPSNGRYLIYEGATGVLNFIPSSGYWQLGYYDGTHVLNILKSIGKCTAISGSVNTTAYSNVTPASNVSTGATDLISINTAAAILATNKDIMRIHMKGNFAANGNSKGITSVFGGSTVATIPASTYNGSTWDMEIWVWQTANNQQGYWSKSTVGTAVVDQSSGTLAITTSSAVNVKSIGTGGASNDITQTLLNIDVEAACPNG